MPKISQQNFKNGKIYIDSSNSCYVQNIRIEPSRQQLNRTTRTALKKEDYSNSIKNIEAFSHSFSSSFAPHSSSSLNLSHCFFTKYFAPFLLHNTTRVIIFLLFIGYISLAIVGCFNFREGLEPSHLVTSDHYIGKYFDDMKIFWKMGAQLHVAVSFNVEGGKLFIYF